MAEDDDTEKPHEPTPRKLEEARRKGNLPRSADLTSVAAMTAMIAVAFLPDHSLAGSLGRIGRALLEQSDGLSRGVTGGGEALASLILIETGRALAPLALGPIAAVIATLVAVRGLVMAPDKLAPKLSRISPIATARQKFGLAAMFEFAKSVLKLGIYVALLWAYLGYRLADLMMMMSLGPNQAAGALAWMTVEFLVLVLAVMALVGIGDTLFQRFEYRRQQRMSHREMQEELKAVEGDPYLKQARRARAEGIATNRMMSDVPTATVVIVNPTHVAVALRWSSGDGGAPVCVAKGIDGVALRIREIAAEAGVPIHSDPPTARALHASTRIGQEIAPEHYAPVAAAIRFAEHLRALAGPQRRR